MRRRPLLPAAAALLHSPYFVWVLLAVPGAYLTYGYWQGRIFYGEYLHATGELAARLLIVTLAITPLSLMFARARWVRWLRRRRRYLGVAVFGYSMLHTGAYLQRETSLADILDEALEIWMAAGWIALAIMVALAVTSNDLSMRAMRRGWKWLHRAVYAAAALTFAHWALSAFDPVPAYVHLGVLAALEGYRVAKLYVLYQPSSTPPSNQSQSR